MGNEKCLIPSKISVGFQERAGTYTGKLAYVVYYDVKGVRRKEKSWESWRDKKIPIMEFANEPTDGFVLNKGVGGARESYGYNARNEYIRVYDPRNFEFEISVANLLFILQECNSYKGKGLEGKFVYSWQGTELVLLPDGCEDYKKSSLHTEMQSMGVKMKELVPGAYYTTKKNVDVIYIGKFTQYDIFLAHDKYRYRGGVRKENKPPEPKHTFWDAKNETWVFTKDLKFLAHRKGDAIAENFAELSLSYAESMHASKASRLELRPAAHERKYVHSSSTHWNYEKKGVFYQRQSNWYGATPTVNTPDYAYALSSYVITPEGVIKADYDGTTHYDPAHPNAAQRRLDSTNKWIPPTNFELWVIMESGKEYIIRDETLIEPTSLKPLNTIESHG